MNRVRSLEAVRREIDAIDDQIHDLIVRRTGLVEEVRGIKRSWPIKIQPSREADILYRLVLSHRGPFPKRELATIWRLLIVATLSFEGPFSVAVHVAGGPPGLWDLARDHFGPFVPMTREGSVDRILDMVVAQQATVGVVPLPDDTDAQPWWLRLTDAGPMMPRVIARLPFIAGGNAWTGGVEALVLCPVSLVPTGRDRSYLMAEAAAAIDRERLELALHGIGLRPLTFSRWRQTAEHEPPLALIEVEGFVADDDPRLNALAYGRGDATIRLRVVGGYAIPLTDEELLEAPLGSAGSRVRA